MSHLRRIALWSAALLSAAVMVPSAAGAHARSAHWSGWNRTYGATVLTLNQGTAGALTQLGVTAAPISPASATPSGDLRFPITDSLARALYTGTITHSGGISLTAGATVVKLTDFDINLGQRSLSAVVNGGPRVGILSLDYSGARVSFAGDRLRFGPVTASLTAAAASALNSAFNVTAFTPGLTLGTAVVNYRLSGLF